MTSGRKLSIVLAEPFHDDELAGLRGFGVTFDAPEHALSPEELTQQCKNADIVVVRNRPIMRHLLENSPHLALVARVGHGSGNVDVEAASEVGVIVTHTPDFDATTRAERLIMLAGLADTRMLEENPEYRPQGLQFTSLAVVGDGVATTTVARVVMALGMRLRVWSPTLTVARATEFGARHADSLSELLATSQMIALLRPGLRLNDVDMKRIPKGGSLLLGGQHLDLPEDTMVERLKDQSLAILGLHDSVAPSTRERLTEAGARFLGKNQLDSVSSRRNVDIMLTRSVNEFLQRKRLSLALNLDPPQTSNITLLLRHQMSAQTLTAVLSQLSEAGIGVIGIDSRAFAKKSAAITRIQIDSPPAPDIMMRLRSSRGVFTADTVDV